MADAPPRTPPTDLPSLTALRFFAALWVVVYHYRDHLSYAVPRWLFLNNGTRAVDFFFLLSGFILAHVYHGASAQGRFRAGDFLVKRFARLYPMHLLMILAALAVLAMSRIVGMNVNSPDKYDLAQLVPNLLLVQTWFPFTHAAFNLPAWSISDEFAAYLLFPLLLPLVMARRVPAAAWIVLAVVLLLASVAAYSAWTGNHLLNMTKRLAVLRIFPLFLLGIVLWRAWRERLIVPPRIVVPIAGVLALAFASFPLVDVALFAAIIPAAAEMDARVASDTARRTILASSGLVLLGEASYSLYMIHDLIQTVLFALLDRLHWPLAGALRSTLCVGGGVLLAVALSIPSYLLFERPARDWILRCATGRRRPLPPEPAL